MGLLYKVSGYALYSVVLTYMLFGVGVSRHILYSIVSNAYQLPRFGKRELICLLSLTCNHVVSVRRGFLFLLVLVMGCVILLCYSLGLPYNYFLVRIYNIFL